MKLRNFVLVGLLGLSSFCNAATGDFAPTVVNKPDVTSYFKKLLPNTSIDKIYTTPYPDTYALILGQGVVYGNLHNSYLVSGHMFNIYTQTDITDQLVKMNTPKIDISKLNLSDAVVSKATIKTNKKLIVFVDPDCPYCRQLEAQIYEQGIDKKANIYYVLMPLPMHPNAKEHIKNIICSNDQINTLKEYMVKENDNVKVALASGCNIEPILERTGSLARGLGINGTPAIITGTGDLIMGSDIQAISDYVNSK